MKEERLFRIIGDVDDDLVEEAATPSRPALRPAVLRWGGIAAGLALVLGLGLVLPRFLSAPRLQPRPQAVEPMAARAEIEPFSSPMGVRKFLHYGGYRYAFLEDGAPYDLSGVSLSGYLGTLEYDILEEMGNRGGEEAPTRDWGTTFALGGEVYAISGYDSRYRLAVVREGETYLAELVGRVDNEPLDAGYYLTVSDLRARVRRVEIYPHMGGEPLSTVNKGEAAALVDLLAGARPAGLTEADYLAVAEAQSAGRSWQLALCLNDSTALRIYLIPDLGFVSIGDNTYVLPEEFGERWGGHLEKLVQGAMPLH